MQKTVFYVGSDNVTHQVNRPVLIGVLSELQGYTLQYGEGVWEGTSEECAIVTYFGDIDADVLGAKLRDALNQQCVLIEQGGVGRLV